MMLYILIALLVLNVVQLITMTERGFWYNLKIVAIGTLILAIADNITRGF